MSTSTTTADLAPWDEEPPEVPTAFPDELMDLTPTALTEKVAKLSYELDRASRVLAKRISTAARARADYELEHDRLLLQIRGDGKRTAVDERKALIHDRIDPDLYRNAELAGGLVDSARAWVRGLEQQLSAAQSMLKAVTQADLTPEFLRELEHRRRQATPRPTERTA